MIANGDGRYTVLGGIAEPVAFLATLDRPSGDLLIPLRAGRTRIGRGSYGDHGDWPKPYAIEQAQWLIECRDGVARVCDAASTNLSTLTMPGMDAFTLPHPNTLVNGQLVVELAFFPLVEGAILRSCYASFVFRWRER